MVRTPSYLLLPIGIVAAASRGRAGDRRRRARCLELLGVMYLSYVGYFLVAGGRPEHPLQPRAPLGPVADRGAAALPASRAICLASGRRLPSEPGSSTVELTKKDCFPSGHVAVAIVCWFLARRVDRPALAPVVRDRSAAGVDALDRLASGTTTWWTSSRARCSPLSRSRGRAGVHHRISGIGRCRGPADPWIPEADPQ